MQQPEIENYQAAIRNWRIFWEIGLCRKNAPDYKWGEEDAKTR